jgi:hypothetical protein
MHYRRNPLQVKRFATVTRTRHDRIRRIWITPSGRRKLDHKKGAATSRAYSLHGVDSVGRIRENRRQSDFKAIPEIAFNT